MKKFIVIYNAPAEAMAKMSTATPAEKEAGMKMWMDWKAKVGNTIVDFGAPLMPGQVTNAGGNWSNAGTEVSGYSILQGESQGAVQALLHDHPHLQWHPNATIAIHEVIPM